jgi:hypothetical protein
MDSMDFIWGELQQAIEMKILEEQQEASSDTPTRTPEKQQQFQETVVPPPEMERPPGERPFYNSFSNRGGIMDLWICNQRVVVPQAARGNIWSRGLV